MLKMKILVLAMLLPILASAVQKEALLVGVEEYKNGHILQGISKDMKKMKKYFESKGFHVTVLFNENATVANVVATLKKYASLKEEDVFAYYQSSHGGQVEDDNGDEEDELDEAYLLYEAEIRGNSAMSTKGLLIDDVLNNLLANIQAKKILFVDSCHSGTSYKSYNPALQSKNVYLKGSVPNTLKVLGSLAEAKNLVVLSASQDNQNSLASKEGSVFTSALYDTLIANPDISFKNLENMVTKHIANSCAYEQSKGREATTFQPALYATTSININQSVNSFLEVNITIQRDTLVEDFLDELKQRTAYGSLYVGLRASYLHEEFAYLDIDTGKKAGYLYILTIPEGENKIEVLYPNKYYTKVNGHWGGSFAFPAKEDSFKFQVWNDTQRPQRTVVYTILSDREIPMLENSANLSSSKFQSIMKDFMGKISLKNAFKNILIQPKNNSLSVEKSIFTVSR